MDRIDLIQNHFQKEQNAFRNELNHSPLIQLNK